MRMLFVTDGRSPISQNWIRYFAERGDEVYIASTFACELGFPVKQLVTTPVAFSAFKKQVKQRAGTASARTLGLRTLIRQWLGPLTISRSAKKLYVFTREIKPDFVHAMRIPYEGMLAARALGDREAKGISRPPLIVSVWGNDFTLHAPSTPLMKYLTRRTMKVTDALHADVERDIRLAHAWGLGREMPTFVAPGNGGIRGDVFYPPKEMVKEPVIINPRGSRSYVRNDVFFRSIPLILAKRPDARFVCASMAGETQAIQWMKELKIEHAVELLEAVPHTGMGDIFRKSQIIVSPSVHDGTPNSLIEGMACGCFPIAGDLESLREWITHGQNGLLADPNDPQSLADATLLALEREDLRREAAGLNAKLISARAEYRHTMQRVDEFYRSVL